MRESKIGSEQEKHGPKSGHSNLSGRGQRIAADARFSVLWVLAVAGAVAALSVFLAVRVRSVDMAYELGEAYSRLSRLREVKRVLQLEVASYESPDRVALVAGRLLGMAPAGGRVVRLSPGPQPGRSHTRGSLLQPDLQTLAGLATPGAVSSLPGRPLR